MCLLTGEAQLHSGDEFGAKDRTWVQYGYSLDPHSPRLTKLDYPHGGIYDSRSRFGLHFHYADRLSSSALNRVAAISEASVQVNPLDVFSPVTTERGFGVLSNVSSNT